MIILCIRSEMEDINEDFENDIVFDEDFIDDYEDKHIGGAESDNESFDEDKIKSSDNEDEDDDDDNQSRNDPSDNEDEEAYINTFDEEETNSLKTSSNSLMRNKLTKYEFTRLFGLRVTQLYHGASPMVKTSENMSVEDIVKKEFLENRIPLIVERTLPKDKNNKEYRRLNELFNVVAH
jgi:DNA-directed RNA polymerase subunit K/omega